MKGALPAIHVAQLLSGQRWIELAHFVPKPGAHCADMPPTMTVLKFEAIRRRSEIADGI